MSQETSQHWLSAISFYNEKQLTAAMRHLKEVLKRNPDHSGAALMAANIFLQNNQLREARLYFEKAKKHPQRKEEALLGLIALAERMFDQFEHLSLLKELTAIAPINSLYRYHLGIIAMTTGDINLAEQALLACNESQFYTPGLYLNLGHVYKAQGSTSLAAEYYHRHIEKEKEHPSAGYWSLADLKNYKFTQADINHIEEVIVRNRLSEAELSLMRFSKAKYLEQTENYFEALSAYQQANSAMANLRPFKKTAFSNLLNDLMSFKPGSQSVDMTDTQSLTPIFIVGMPRSGTTLTEQILANHSRIDPTDELPYIERYAIDIQRNTSYSMALRNMSEETKTVIRQHYLSKAKHYFDRTDGYFIDKNPNNFLHIGLIKILFPNAKIINLLRNVADNSLAVFKQFFSRGHDYSYSLQSISSYWEGYIRLMQHWDKCYPKQILHLKYEDLVSNPEHEIRNLLQYVGVTFEEDCLYFYNSNRAVLTPSSSQVRKPMDMKAIGQASHFKPYLPEAFANFSQQEKMVIESFIKI